MVSLTVWFLAYALFKVLEILAENHTSTVLVLEYIEITNHFFVIRQNTHDTFLVTNAVAF